MHKSKPQKPSQSAKIFYHGGEMGTQSRLMSEHEMFEALYDKWLGLDRSARRRLARVAAEVTKDHESP